MAAVGTSPGNPYAKKKVRVVTSDSPIHAVPPLQSSSDRQMRGSLSIDLCLNAVALASSTSPPQPPWISEREKSSMLPGDHQRAQISLKEIFKQLGVTDEALLMELWGMGDCSFDHFFAVLQSRLDSRGSEHISQQVARRIYMVCQEKREQAGECVPFPQKGEDKVSQSKNSRRAEIPRVISAKVGPGLAGLDEWCNDVILQLSAEDRPRTSESANTRGSFASSDTNIFAPPETFRNVTVALSQEDRQTRREERHRRREEFFAAQKIHKISEVDLSNSLQFAVLNEQAARLEIAKVLDQVAAERAKQQEMQMGLVADERQPQLSPLPIERVQSGTSGDISKVIERRESRERSTGPSRASSRAGIMTPPEAVKLFDGATRPPDRTDSSYLYEASRQGTLDVSGNVSGSGEMSPSVRLKALRASTARVAAVCNKVRKEKAGFASVENFAYLERWSKETANDEKRRRRKQRYAALQEDASIRQHTSAYVASASAQSSEVTGTTFYQDNLSKGLHGLRKQETPVLLWDCKEHIADGLSQLQREIEAEQARTHSAKQKARDASGGRLNHNSNINSKSIEVVNGGCEEDVHMKLRRQIARTKVFELPLQCLILNFRGCSSLLRRIVAEYEDVFAQYSVVRQHALRQVVQESAGTDLEYRERKAVYTYKVAQLRQNIDALRKVIGVYDEHIKQLGADKAEVDKRLSTEEQKVSQSQSMVQQISAANQKLEADLANLQDVTAGITELSTQLHTVRQRRSAAIEEQTALEMEKARLEQQVKDKKSDVELIQYMEKLVKWRQRQIPQAAASGERDRET